MLLMAYCPGLWLNIEVMSGDSLAAVVAVEPRLLADAITRYLELRGLQVSSSAPPGQLVDLVVTDDTHRVPGARVVVTLPREPGETGSVSFVGQPAFLAVGGLADLDAALRLLDA
jgi:hypothetical protein